MQSNDGIFNIKDASDHSSLFNNSLGFKFDHQMNFQTGGRNSGILGIHPFDDPIEAS